MELSISCIVTSLAFISYQENSRVLAAASKLQNSVNQPSVILLIQDLQNSHTDTLIYEKIPFSPHYGSN